MIPRGGAMTMPEIYAHETGTALPGSTPAEQAAAGQTLTSLRVSARSVSAKKVLDNPSFVTSGFARLPNPMVTMTIYPHFVYLNGESYPKPETKTAFFLYPKNHFALPSEPREEGK